MDTFLEREQQLMKLNETLNSKISFDWKVPNVTIASTTTKFKSKPPPNKSIKAETNSAKCTTTTTNVRQTPKSKNDNCGNNKITINTNGTHTIDANATKHKQNDLDGKDNAYGANNRNGSKLTANKPDQTHDQPPTNGVKSTMTEFTAAIADKLISNDRIEMNASALSLIPQTMMKRNVSSDGIIK